MIYLVAETWILLESNLVEKLKIIYRGRYKMEEISFQEYTKAQDKLFWSDECYFDLNIDWKESYELLSKKWTGWLDFIISIKKLTLSQFLIKLFL